MRVKKQHNKMAKKRIVKVIRTRLKYGTVICGKEELIYSLVFTRSRRGFNSRRTTLQHDTSHLANNLLYMLLTSKYLLLFYLVDKEKISLSSYKSRAQP